jgi:hypothetical protein
VEVNELMTIKERKLGYEELTKLPVGFHKDFSEKWKEKYGSDFHNEKHIVALMEVSERYLDSCEEDRDPLKVLKSIAAWNEENPEYDLDLEKFKKAAKLAFAWHDMGNIASDLNFEDDTPKYLDVYTAGELEVNGQTKIAEERSKDMFLKALEQSDIEDGEKRLYEKLVPELIMLTVFKQDVPKDESFALFVPVVDQIGNSLLNNDPHKLRGLVVELGVEAQINNDARMINPYYFVNFLNIRMQHMLGGETDVFLQMIGAPMPELPGVENKYDRPMGWENAVKVLEDHGV